MPYIGRGLVQGNYVKLDDLQSQFDGSKTTFTLTSGGQSYSPGSANTLLVSLGGVIQEAITSYTVVNDQITFSNPPTSDAQIFIIALGSAVSIGTPADGTITAPKLNASFGEYSGIGTIIMLVSSVPQVFVVTVVSLQVYLLVSLSHKLLVFPLTHLLVLILQLLMIMISLVLVTHSKDYTLQTEW